MGRLLLHLDVHDVALFTVFHLGGRLLVDNLDLRLLVLVGQKFLEPCDGGGDELGAPCEPNTVLGLG
jgi:hypothetical protein